MKKQLKVILIVVTLIIFSVVIFVASHPIAKPIDYTLSSRAKMHLDKSGIADQDAFLDKISGIVDGIELNTDYTVDILFAGSEAEERHKITIGMATKRVSLSEHKAQRYEDIVWALADQIVPDKSGMPVGLKVLSLSVSWSDTNIVGRTSRYAVCDENADGVWDSGACVREDGKVTIKVVHPLNGAPAKQELVTRGTQPVSLGRRYACGTPFWLLERTLSP